MSFAKVASALVLVGVVAGCRSASTAAPVIQPVSAPAGTALVAARGMVVSATQLSSDIGNDVLRNGGNAIDAAIATGFALAVTYPRAGNIGGGGFMVVRFPDGRVTSFDFREKAPLKAHANMFLDENGEYSSTIRHDSRLAVGVPGTVAGFALAHSKYGTAKWADLVRPSVRLARDGFVAMPGFASSLAGELERFKRYPGSFAAFSNNGIAYEEGELFKQLDLARTLERIEQEGHDGFYKGDTPRLVAEEMRRGGGMITEEDFAKYQMKERAPVRGTYRGYEIISMAPPSSGGVAMIQMLNILEGYDLKSLGHNSAQHVHYLTESMRRAFLDRARFLADPDFSPVPIQQLISKEYATRLRATIDPRKASPSQLADVHVTAESIETTHYSVVDAGGMAVSVTYTLEDNYGVGIVAPGTGFLLNNEMGDFNPKLGLTNESGMIGTPPNLARPEQRMLSSMTPSIVAKDGRVVAVVGSPGGRTIINTVLQVISNLIDFGMSPQQAVDAKRIHHQWLPDKVTIERGGVSEKLVGQLQAIGHDAHLGSAQGHAHSIFVDAQGRRHGVADQRDRDAGAAGY